MCPLSGSMFPLKGSLLPLKDSIFPLRGPVLLLKGLMLLLKVSTTRGKDPICSAKSVKDVPQSVSSVGPGWLKSGESRLVPLAMAGGNIDRLSPATHCLLPTAFC
jgi:hypothetical protein